eukprot:TRINITY_DN3267_c0_g1_i1.p1 TRINITY_DN3267_c0_g1~~TRINITY_DN3267_c0_g1_i1.p1  ORF type:complete len:372 (-),score=38.22 TRINITY_DN3267_c0_g1_i1:37-1020(-)
MPAASTEESVDDEPSNKRRRTCDEEVDVSTQSADFTDEKHDAEGRPLTDSQLVAETQPLPGSVTHRVESELVQTEPPVCAICLDSLASRASCSLAECGHSFHVACIISAFRRLSQSSCPCCRRNGAGSGNVSSLPDGAQAPRRVRNLCLQTMSDDPDVSGDRLPCINLSELRSLNRALGELGRRDCQEDASLQSILLFGRHELVNLSRDWTMRTRLHSGPHRGRWAQCQVRKFVSREVFYMEGPPHASVQALVVVAGIYNGLHSRKAGQSMWNFTPEGESLLIEDGDCIALLLECPQGSLTPADRCSYGSEEVRCILGVVFQACTES